MADRGIFPGVVDRGNSPGVAERGISPGVADNIPLGVGVQRIELECNRGR